MLYWINAGGEFRVVHGVGELEDFKKQYEEFRVAHGVGELEDFKKQSEEALKTYVTSLEAIQVDKVVEENEISFWDEKNENLYSAKLPPMNVSYTTD